MATERRLKRVEAERKSIMQRKDNTPVERPAEPPLTVCRSAPSRK